MNIFRKSPTNQTLFLVSARDAFYRLNRCVWRRGPLATMCISFMRERGESPAMLWLQTLRVGTALEQRAETECSIFHVPS